MWTDQLVFEGGGVAFFCSAGNLENDTFAGISKNADYSPQCVVPKETLFGKKKKNFLPTLLWQKAPP